MSEYEFSVRNANVKKKIIKEGKLGRRPSLGWVCGIVIVYENQDCGENIEVTIGNACNAKDRLIELCLETMYVGEESTFVVEQEKQNIHLKCNIILNFCKERPYIFQWTDSEKLDIANLHKSKGIELFKENNIEEAFYKFSMALKLTMLLDSVLEIDEPESNVNNLRVALYNNLAGCHLHFKNYSSVVKLCTSSLNLSFTSKAFYRRALAYIELKEYEKAENDLSVLLKLEPKNKAAFEKYKLVRELDRSNRETYELIVKKMFH